MGLSTTTRSLPLVVSKVRYFVPVGDLNSKALVKPSLMTKLLLPPSSARTSMVPRNLVAPSTSSNAVGGEDALYVVPMPTYPVLSLTNIEPMALKSSTSKLDGSCARTFVTNRQTHRVASIHAVRGRSGLRTRRDVLELMIATSRLKETTLCGRPTLPQSLLPFICFFSP